MQNRFTNFNYLSLKRQNSEMHRTEYNGKIHIRTLNSKHKQNHFFFLVMLNITIRLILDETKKKRRREE